jgi:ABC-type multidrug transport system ATPase subunit
MDPPGVTLLREILLDLKRRNATIVLNSHHLDEMERICDRVAFIKNGEIQAIKTMSDESDYPHVLRLRFLPWQDDAHLAEKLEGMAVSTGASLLEFDKRTARFAVASGEIASRVIQTGVEKQLRIQSASPESTSLERLFTETPFESLTGRLEADAE